MALKDLAAQKSALTEEAVEAVVKDFVRYDVDEYEIAFTPEFSQLSNRAKVLVYLTGLQGWPFVTDEAVPTEAKPAKIGEQVGIPGGTLRPILKDLKDRHLIAYKAGSYSVRSSSLDTVRRELDGNQSGRQAPANRKSTKKRSGKSSKAQSASGEIGTNSDSTRRSRSTSRDIGAAFKGLVDDGFFDDGRTLPQVQEKFHENAIIIPKTSIPKYLLAAVRDGRLTRTKEDVSGKQIWVYRTKI